MQKQVTRTDGTIKLFARLFGLEHSALLCRLSIRKCVTHSFLVAATGVRSSTAKTKVVVLVVKRVPVAISRAKVVRGVVKRTAAVLPEAPYTRIPFSMLLVAYLFH